MEQLDHRPILDRRSQQLLVLRLVLFLLNLRRVMKSLEQRSVGGCRLLRRLPELLLSRVAIHGRNLEQAVPELLRRSVEVASFGTNDSTIIDEA